MIQVGRIVKDYSEAGSFNVLLPYLAALDNYTFLNKSGDMAQFLRMEGVDYECMDAGQRDQVARRFESVLRNLDENYCIRQFVLKRDDVPIPSRPHDNKVVQQATASRIAYLQGKRKSLYSLETYLAVIYEGGKLQRSLGISDFARDPLQFFRRMSDKATMSILEEELTRAQQTLTDRVMNFVVQMPDSLKVKVLDKQQAFRFLRRLVNYEPYKADHVGLKYDSYVDFQACDSTLECYTKTVEWRYGAHVKPTLGSLPASRFGSTQVKRYIEMRRDAGASDTTINRELSIVRRAFKLGLQQDPPLVHRQPPIPQLEEDNARQGFLERDQYEKLLAELPENLRAMYVCGYHTGARKGELREIRWPQVDFEARLIRLSVSQTKGKKARSMPIYGDMEYWLRSQQETCPPNSPWVFHGQHGFPVDAHLLGWAEACQRAGLPGLYFHDLRRSAVRNMKRAGIQDGVAMAISGHKTRSVFERYNIIDEDDMGDAGEKLERFFEKRKAERAAKLKRVK
jgi:integrase